MNYLAHAYLSFNNPAWVTGNLISDFVKGRRRYDYPHAIQQGITLHRAIDEFTDMHEGIKEAKEIFKPAYRLYAGAFVDVVYDHFLANDPLQFEGEHGLMNFTTETYESLQQHYHEIPGALHGMFDRMRQQNWLYNYRHLQGMERSFNGLVYRSKYLVESETAFELFKDNYEILKKSYDDFFPRLKKFTEYFIEENLFEDNK